MTVQGQRACEPQAQSRLQLQAFEAINEVVRGASDATQPLIGQLVPLMLSKISQTFQTPPPGAPADARMRQQELQVGLHSMERTQFHGVMRVSAHEQCVLDRCTSFQCLPSRRMEQAFASLNGSAQSHAALLLDGR